MSRFGGWNSGRLLWVSCGLPEDGLNQRGSVTEEVVRCGYVAGRLGPCAP